MFNLQGFILIQKVQSNNCMVTNKVFDIVYTLKMIILVFDQIQIV